MLLVVGGSYCIAGCQHARAVLPVQADTRARDDDQLRALCLDGEPARRAGIA